MNRVKQLAVFLLVFVMCFGMCVTVFADEYGIAGEELGDGLAVAGTEINQPFTKTNDLCTAVYYAPANYKYLLITGNTANPAEATYVTVWYYGDNGSLKYDNFPDKVMHTNALMTTFTSYTEAMEFVFFNLPNYADYTEKTSGYTVMGCFTYVYTDQSTGMGNSNGTYQQELPTAYYNYFYEKNGYHPVPVEIRFNYLCNGNIIETKTTTLTAGTSVMINELLEIPDGYTKDKITINDSEFSVTDEYLFTENTSITVTMTATTSTDSTGIIAKLHEIWEAVIKIANPTPDYSFIADMNNKLAHKLEDNGFYTSLCRIQRELSSLYNQDYSDPAEFRKINPAKITLRKPVIASDDGMSYTYSKIDWGLDNVSIIGDMKWFFGTHYNTGKVGVWLNVDGSYAVKHYSDAIISAFLWIGFAFMLWQRLPSIISGDFATMTATTADVVNTSVAGSRTVDDMYRTTKVDMATGEVLSDTMTTKRRVKK